MKKYNLAKKICDIVNNYQNKFGAITMNNRWIIWASKKGYVIVLSATQQQLTEKGCNWLKNMK